MIESTYNEASLLVGALIAIVLEYVPYVKTRFEALTPWQKRAVVTAMCLVITATVLLITCQTDAAACPTGGWFNGFIGFIYALVSSQAAHGVFKRG